MHRLAKLVMSIFRTQRGWHSYCFDVVRFIYGLAKMQTSSTTSVSSSASATYSTALPDISTDIATLNSDGIKALSTATISSLTTAQLALVHLQRQRTAATKPRAHSNSNQQHGLLAGGAAKPMLADTYVQDLQANTVNQVRPHILKHGIAHGHCWRCF